MVKKHREATEEDLGSFIQDETNGNEGINGHHLESSSTSLKKRNADPLSSLNGINKQVYVVGIAGGSASGKTSVSEKIVQSLGSRVAMVPMDAFYRPLSKENIEKAFRNDYNFDQPSSIDNDLVYECIKDLKQGKSVQIPVYDFNAHCRVAGQTETIRAANIVIYEGIFAFCDERIRNTMDLKIFVDADSDIRLARRIQRDVFERGRDVEGILQQYARFVKPSFENYIRPTRKFADLIIPRGNENTVAIDLVTRNIHSHLEALDLNRPHVLPMKEPFTSDLPAQVIALPDSGQLRALHTIIRNRETNPSEFNFYSDRLSSLVVERALAEQPTLEKLVETPHGKMYRGATFTDNICGISVLPSGATMETGLRRVCKDIHIGHLLIQPSKMGEQNFEVIRSSLPDGLTKQIIFLMDSFVTTGISSLLAIQFLKDHGVPETQIVFLCQIATTSGLRAIAKAYPQVRIIVSEIGESFQMNPYFESAVPMNPNGLCVT